MASQICHWSSVPDLANTLLNAALAVVNADDGKPLSKVPKSYSLGF